MSTPTDLIFRLFTHSHLFHHQNSLRSPKQRLTKSNPCTRTLLCTRSSVLLHVGSKTRSLSCSTNTDPSAGLHLRSLSRTWLLRLRTVTRPLKSLLCRSYLLLRMLDPRQQVRDYKVLHLESMFQFPFAIAAHPIVHGYLLLPINVYKVHRRFFKGSVSLTPPGSAFTTIGM